MDKELAIWLQGMCHLLLLFYFSRGTAPEQRLLQKLKRVGMDPHEYTFSRFQSFAVYLKAPVSWSSRSSLKQRDRWMYVSSTSVSTCKREYNRQSKLKQVLLEQYVQVEPAIRIWASLGTYFDFSTVCVSVHRDYREAWIQEHILIDRWQPRFHPPFIDRFYLKSALGFKRLKPRPSLKTVSLFSRLWGKVRRRAGTTSTPIKCLMDKQQAWSLLYDLASLTIASFEAAKTVRSAKKAFFCKWGSFFFKWVSNLVFLASYRNTMNRIATYFDAGVCLCR